MTLTPTNQNDFRFGPLDFYPTQNPHPQRTSLSWCPSSQSSVRGSSPSEGELLWPECWGNLNSLPTVTKNNSPFSLLCKDRGWGQRAFGWAGLGWQFSVSCFITGRWPEHWSAGYPMFSDVNSVRRVPQGPHHFPSHVHPSVHSSYIHSPLNCHLWLANSIRPPHTRLCENQGANISTRLKPQPALAVKQAAPMPTGPPPPCAPPGFEHVLEPLILHCRKWMEGLTEGSWSD